MATEAVFKESTLKAYGQTEECHYNLWICAGSWGCCEINRDRVKAAADDRDTTAMGK